MQTARKIFINSFFAFLKGTDYLALKYVLDCPADLAKSSDFDLLVASNLVGKIERFCTLHPLVSNIKTQSSGERYTLRLYFADGEYLKLDLLSTFQRCGLIYLDQKKCREWQVTKGDVQTYAPEHLLEHVFLYYFMNGAAVPAKYIQYAKRLPAAVKTTLLPHLNHKYGLELKELEELGIFRTEYQAKINAKVKHASKNSWLKVAQRRLKQWKDQLVDRLQNWGRIVTFSGVDGAGKTTLLKRLAQVLREEHGEKVIVMRHRPGILPILSAWKMGKKAASEFHAQRLPRQGTNSSMGSSLLRFAYYFTDYLLGQWWIQLRYCALGYTVIYDRYYFDFIADPRRSNLRLPRWITQPLYNLLLQPSLNIFLYARPSTILERKQELDERTIIELTESYRAIFDEYQTTKSTASYPSIQNEHEELSMRQILQWYNYKCA